MEKKAIEDNFSVKALGTEKYPDSELLSQPLKGCTVIAVNPPPGQRLSQTLFCHDAPWCPPLRGEVGSHRALSSALILLRYPRSEEPGSDTTQPLQQCTTTKRRLI